MDLMELGIAIKATGDRQALAALKQVETAGKRAADTQVAGSRRVEEQIQREGMRRAQMHADAIRMDQQRTASATAALATAKAESDAMRMRVGMGAIAMAGALEMMTRQGKVTGEALKMVVVQGSMMAAMYGPQGAIVGAIGVTGVALWNFFNRAKAEAEALRKKTEETALAIRSMGFEQAGAFAGAKYGEMQRLEREIAALEGGNRQVTGVRDGNVRAGFGIHDDAIAAKRRDLAAATEAHRMAYERFTTSVQAHTKVQANAARIARDEAAAQARVTAALSEQERERDTALRRAAERIAQLPQIIATPDLGRYRTVETPQVAPDKDLERETAKGIAAAREALLEAERQFHEMLDNIIVTGFSNAIQAAFASAFSGKGLAGIFSSFASTMMASLGQAITMIGARLIKLGGILTAFENALKTMGPFAGPAALIAGAALLALAGTMGNAGGGGGSRGGGYGRDSGSRVTTYALSPQAQGLAANARPRESTQVYITNIGEPTPKDVRTLTNAVAKGISQRGMQRRAFGLRG